MSVPARMLAANITLDQLLQGLAEVPPIEVSGISSDSRQLEAGDVFLAVQGVSAHGLDFLDQAIAAKVAAIVWDSRTASARTATVPMIPVDNLAAHIGSIANRCFDSPSRRLQVTGVTGTNGKTTIAYLIMQCLRLVDQQCAYIGTLGAGIGDITGSGGMTTPACIELHRLLAGFADAGAGHAALDYHGSMRAYGDSKARLFLDYDVEHRIINLDTEFGLELAARIGPHAVTVSSNFDRVPAGRPHVFVRSVVAGEHGSKIAFTSSWGNGEFNLPLPGNFNVANAMEVLAAMLCWEIPLARACDVLGKVAAPPGRMQRVALEDETDLPAVFVDYSHTPASLEAALRALRAHCTGKLWCIFGCGGDRDRGKRRLMGAIAARHADHPVVTNDNPRSEPPMEIIAAILEEMNDDTVVIEDREAAITHAIDAAGADDIVLIAGKGHEDYQIIGKQRRPFSDYNIARVQLHSRFEKGALGR